MRDSISEQLPVDRASEFVAHDLSEAITALSLIEWESLPEIERSQGSPAWRYYPVGIALRRAGELASW